MDLLTDLFRESGLSHRLLDLRQLPPDRALRFPCDRSVGFHVVIEGTLYLHGPSLPEPLKLDAGDIAVMGRGAEHFLSARPSLRGLAVEAIALAASGEAPASGEVTVVSGAYQLWNTPVHPFFAELPPWFVLRGDRAPSLGPVGLTVAMLADEARRDSMGRDTVLYGLLDVLFTHLLRAIVERQGGQAAGWSHAMRDAQVRQAVTLLHAQYAHEWTLDSLATAVGLSRSVLAERFRREMGEPPLAYLRMVRLQRAMRLLGESDRTLEQVALAVGYHDAFGFSKAFKRAVGMSPGEFRKQDAADRALPWRLQAADAVGAG